MKVLLVPLSNNPVFTPAVKSLSQKLRAAGISNRIDASGTSIGRRYARNDGLGTPLGVTVDFQSLKDNTYTLRDRDTMKQVRASADDILGAISSLVEGKEDWVDVAKRLPAFTEQVIETEELPAR
jgi:glycyl-tRNA synthetase